MVHGLITNYEDIFVNKKSFLKVKAKHISSDSALKLLWSQQQKTFL